MLRLSPGLSAFADDPADGRIAAQLAALLAFAEKALPARALQQTPVALLATEGLRRLDESSAEAVLAACRPVLAASPFQSSDRDVSVLSGAEEGAFAWVAANYAAGRLAGGWLDPRATLGVVELGGASAQVTFVPQAAVPAAYRSDVLLPGRHRFHLYTHSFAGLGLDAVRATRRSDSSDACDSVPVGGRGAGAARFAACRSAAAAALHLDAPCAHERCGGGGVFLPPPLAGQRLMAVENFAWVADALALPPSATLAQLAAAGAALCGQPDAAAAAPEGALLLDCFGVAYVLAFLSDTVGIGPQDTRLEWANDIAGLPIAWPLGALLMRVADAAPPPPGLLAAAAQLGLGGLLAAAGGAVLRGPGAAKGFGRSGSGLMAAMVDG